MNNKDNQKPSPMDAFASLMLLIDDLDTLEANISDDATATSSSGHYNGSGEHWATKRVSAANPYALLDSELSACGFEGVTFMPLPGAR